jgi:hypothetical protein
LFNSWCNLMMPTTVILIGHCCLWTALHELFVRNYHKNPMKLWRWGKSILTNNVWSEAWTN